MTYENYDNYNHEDFAGEVESHQAETERIQPKLSLEEVKAKLGDDVFSQITDSHFTTQKDTSAATSSVIRQAYKHISEYDKALEEYQQAENEAILAESMDPAVAMHFYSAQAAVKEKAEQAEVYEAYLYYALRLISESISREYSHSDAKLSELNDNF